MRGGALAGLCVAATVGVGALAGPAQAAPSPYPKAEGFVVDTAGKISAADEAALERQLKAYKRETGNEVAVLVVSTLEGRTVETYATGVFNTWGVGKKDKNNGVLLLVAMKERKLRIEVGRGLRKVLDDEEAATILDDRVRPLLRTGDVSGAVQAGAAAIQVELDAGPDADAPPAGDLPGPSRYDDAPVGGFQPVGDFDRDDDGFGSAVGLIFLLGVLLGIGSLVVKAASGASSRGPSTGRRGIGSTGIWSGGGSDRTSGTWWHSSSSGSDSGSSSFGSSSGGGSDSGGSSGGSDFGGGSSDGGGASGDW